MSDKDMNKFLKRMDFWNLILEPKYKKIEIRNDNLLDVTDENDSHMVLDSDGNKVDVSKIADLNADEEDDDEN